MRSISILFCMIVMTIVAQSEIVRLRDKYAFIGICKVTRLVDEKTGKATAKLVPIKILHEGEILREGALESSVHYLIYEGMLVAVCVGQGKEGEKITRFVEEDDKNPVIIGIGDDKLRLRDVERMLDAEKRSK